MNRKLIIGLSALVVLAAAGGIGYWRLKSRPSPAPAATSAAAAQAVTEIQDTVDSVNQRLAQGLYKNETATAAGSAVDIPDVNPYRNTNPFSALKTNPFE